MATATAKSVTVIDSVTLELSDSEAAALLYLLRTGCGGSATTSRGKLGRIMVALQQAYGLGSYPDEGECHKIYERSGVCIEMDTEHGHVHVSTL